MCLRGGNFLSEDDDFVLANSVFLVFAFENEDGLVPVAEVDCYEDVDFVVDTADGDDLFALYKEGLFSERGRGA